MRKKAISVSARPRDVSKRSIFGAAVQRTLYSRADLAIWWCPCPHIVLRRRWTLWMFGGDLIISAGEVSWLSLQYEVSGGHPTHLFALHECRWNISRANNKCLFGQTLPSESQVSSFKKRNASFFTHKTGSTVYYSVWPPINRPCNAIAPRWPNSKTKHLSLDNLRFFSGLCDVQLFRTDGEMTNQHLVLCPSLLLDLQIMLQEDKKNVHILVNTFSYFSMAGYYEFQRYIRSRMASS